MAKRKPVSRKPKPKPKNVGRGVSQSGDDYRPLMITLAEVRMLLQLYKRSPELGRLRHRLEDLQQQFEDRALHLKELVQRMNANSYWMNDVSAADQQSLERNKHVATQKQLKDVAALSTKEMKALLAKENQA